VGDLCETVSHVTRFQSSPEYGDTNVQPNKFLDLTILVYMSRAPVDVKHGDEIFPDRNHRDKGETTDRSMKPEEESGRRPTTLYLIQDPDQDPPSSSELVMLVGTMEDLLGRTGGGDVFERGF
jgi:hypothetical protein